MPTDGVSKFVHLAQQVENVTQSRIFEQVSITQVTQLDLPRTHANEDATQGSVIGYVLGMPSSGNLVEGWLGDVNVATTDQVSHVAVEEGK